MSSKLNLPTEAEMDWLDRFLLERIAEDVDVGELDAGIDDLSMLDGFFAAIVSAPELIPPSHWIPSVWGDFEPEWGSREEAEKVLSLLIRYMNGVAAFLAKDPQNFEPIFIEREADGKTHTIVDQWCEGYMRGVNLSADQWQVDSTDMKILLAPIKAFTLGDGVDIDHQLSEQKIDNLISTITPNVVAIHGYWLSQRFAAHPSLSSFRTNEPRVGRNDPCPCGSGKKFKKCCLH